MDETTEASGTQETQEETSDAKQEGEQTLTAEELADLKHKAEVSSQNFERAKKAEEARKVAEEELKKLKGSDKDELSTTDLYALVEAKVPKELVEDVRKAAKVLNLPIAEALNNDIVKTILAKKIEEKASAEAANVSSGRRISTKDTSEELAKKMERGEFPALEDLDKAIAAKYDLKKRK
jgi:hypothetical protein